MKEFENLGSYRAKVSTVSGVSLTKAYGSLSATGGTVSELADTMSVLAGPLAGISEQPPRRRAEATVKYLRKFRTVTSKLYVQMALPTPVFGLHGLVGPNKGAVSSSWKLLLKCYHF